MLAATKSAVAICAMVTLSGAAFGAAIDRTLYAIGVNPNTGNQALIRFDPDNPSDEEYIGELGIVLPEFNTFLSYNPDDDAFYASYFDKMYRINRYTGVTTDLNMVNTFRLQGSAYIPSLGKTVVAHSLSGDAWDRRIAAVNPDGTLTELANFNDGSLVGFQDIDELVYDPSTGDLFGYRFVDSEYYQIDIDTWSIVNIGTYTGSPMVFRGDVNPENGELYFDGADIIPGPGGTQFNGQLDIWTRSMPGHVLGASTGSISLLSKVDGLAFVPTPGAASVLGLAGLVVLRRRR